MKERHLAFTKISILFVLNSLRGCQGHKPKWQPNCHFLKSSFLSIFEIKYFWQRLKRFCSSFSKKLQTFFQISWDFFVNFSECPKIGKKNDEISTLKGNNVKTNPNFHKKGSVHFSNRVFQTCYQIFELVDQISKEDRNLETATCEKISKQSKWQNTVTCLLISIRNTEIFSIGW